MAHPIRWAKTRILAMVITKAWRRVVTKTPQGAETEKAMREWFKGKKELIVHVLGFLTVLATTFGMADAVGPLAKVHDAILAGDPQAVLISVLGLFMFAAAYFRRIALNRKDPETVGGKT